MRAGMRNPVRVTINVHSKIDNEVQSIPSTCVPRSPTDRIYNGQCSSLHNEYVAVNCDDKVNLLVKFLLAHSNEKIIVYFLTGAMVDFFWKVNGEKSA